MTHQATLIKNLRILGLSEKEAILYTVALSRDSFTLAEIAKYSDINRSTCYLIVLELVKKGFILQLPEDKIARFCVLDPKLVGQKVMEQATKAQNILLDASEIRSKVGDIPKIELFRGVEGVKRVGMSVLNDKPKELLSILNTEYSKVYLGNDYLNEWSKKRISLGIKRKSLESLLNKNKRNGPSQFKETRWLKTKRDFLSQLFLWNEKIAFISNKAEGISFIVTSKEFASLIQEMFEILWDGANE